MKNKGMHQQPNAFTPSTGGSAGMNRGAFNPTPSHGNPSSQQQGWQRPQGNQSTATDTSAQKDKGFKKGKKAA